jgi:dipeptidyl aminopeptidase/acylaminoacyl peptidase
MNKTISVLLVSGLLAFGQRQAPQPAGAPAEERADHRWDQMMKAIDDAAWPARVGDASENYRGLFSAPGHIGKTVREDIPEYLRRSPISHVAKLQTPLLIHSNTNDEDVNVLEVQRLIAALQAEGKKFEYKIYQDAAGGHAFNRLDTKAARESRQEIYAFLARHLKR